MKNEHSPTCKIHMACAVVHSDGICPGPYGKCDCGVDELKRSPLLYDLKRDKDKMNMKHEIKTIQDILDVVNQDNADAFLVDFKSFLIVMLLAKSIAESTGEKPPVFEGFTWIDDGNHDATIHIAPLDDEKHDEPH